MDGKQSEAHRRRGQRDNMADDLRLWFCQLSMQERLQAIAVEDVVWIRVFNILYRKHKSWMRQRGKPPTWDRDQVRKLCEKVQRNERNRSGAPSMTSSATCPNGASESRTSTPAIESRTREVPKSRTKAGSEDKNTEAVAQTSVEKEFGDDSGGALTKEEASGHVTNSLSIAAHGRPKSSGNRSGACGDGNGDHKLQTALQVGERLQEAVRLCSLGGDPRGGVRDAPWALTLSEAELSRPRKLLNDLRLYSCRGDGEEAFSVSEKARDGDGSSGGFMSIPLTEADARRVVLSLTEDPLLETAWLSQRFPRAAIGDLLANRLELSLWASYHRIGWSAVLTSPLPAVPRVIEEFHVFWQTLSQRDRLRFLEGVPEAKAVIAGSSGEGTDEEGDDLIRELVLAPIAWCFKDDGASVRGVVERLQQACLDYAAADRTGPLDFSNVEQDANIGSDDLGLTSVAGNVESHGVGDDVVSSGNTASEESSVEHVASEPSSSANTSKSKTSKKNKRKKKKVVDSISLTSGSAEGSEGTPSPEMTTVGQDTSACLSLGDANLSASDDGGAGGEADEEPQQGGSKANGPGTEENARSRGAGAGAASEIVDVVGENAAESNDGWVVSTSRRKIKEPREESKEHRRGGAGSKSNKNKEGGNHPKATAGHRESLRDSQREPYRDKGEVPTRGGKGSARSDLRHDRDDGSNAPWSRGTSRQESGSKGEEGGAWSKGGTLRERREDGSRREKRDGAGAGVGVVAPSGPWPRAGALARDGEDKDTNGSWAKDKEEDAGAWTKRSVNNSARENGYPSSSRIKDSQLDRARSSSFADMLRGAQPSPGGEDAPSASPLVKSKSAKTPKTTSVELLTPAWGSGKPGGAPSFATVLLGGSSATVSSDKSAPPPAINFVDSKAGVPAVSPATVSSSPVATSEAGAWGGDTVLTPATPSASKPAPSKPMAWTTGNTTSVLLFGSAGKPDTRSKGPTTDESQKEQTTSVANGESEDEGKDSAGLSTKASASGKETEGRESVTPNGRRSPTSCCSEDSRHASEAEGGGGVGDVVVEVLDKVGDVIVKKAQAHSRANKAKSYARAMAEREGRKHALATAHQRQDGLLHGSWEDKPSSTQPVVTILAAETTTSSAQGALKSVGVEPAPGIADGSRSDQVSEAVPAEGGIVPTDSGEDVALPGDVSSVGSTVTDDDGDDAGDVNPRAGVIDDPSAIAVPAFVAAPPSVVDELTPAAIVEPSAAEQSCSVPSAPDRAAEREGSGRLGGVESAFVSRNEAGQEEQRRGGALQADNGGGGRGWTERGSDRASWSRGNTPPNVSRNSGRRGLATDAVGGRTWSRSGHAMGGGGGNMAGVPSNDFRGGRPRVQRAASLMTPPHQQQQPQGLEAENWRGTIPIPRAPVVLRSSISTPISTEVSVGIDAGDASARGYTGQSDAVAPSPRVAPSPMGHRPRSSSAGGSSAGGSSARRKGMNAGGGVAGVHYPHFQQMDSWNGNEWTLAGGVEGGGRGGTRRGVRSGGGGGGWQGRDGDVGRPHYPYRDDNLYRSSPMEARAHSSGGGGGASSRHSRQDHVAPRRRGHVDALPRALSAHDQQQAQQQMPLQQQQQPQMPQVPPARFRSRSGGTNDLSINDRRAERMEYEYNLMVSCLDRNVDGFMQKLRRAMRPRRHAWSQVIARVRELVAGIWKEAKVEMYGSCYTGLELPSSDVDVVVCGINGLSYTYGGSRAGYNGMQTVANLQKLANVLQEQNWVRGMKVIETAVVPVIKIHADPSMDGANGQSLFEEEGGRDCWQGSGSGMDYIPLDISFESPYHGGLASSKWVRNCIQGGKYGFALPAVMLLKEVLCQRGLNQPWSGGLSSYSLINMMITVLQRAEVERARARRIVARSHAAAQAAAHIVRQGGLPPPQGMPTLSPQVSVGPQPQTMPPLSPQVSGGPLPSVFAPLPHQAPVSGLATAHVPLVSVSAANFDNVSQDARVDATDGALLQKHQSQPAGETASENGGGGTGTAPCNTGFGRPQSQACAAASGESSSLKPMVSSDGSGGRISARLLSTSAEVGDGAMQHYYAAGDATADHPQPASLVKRKTSYWVETDPSRGVDVGVGSLPASGEPGVQPTTTDGFVGASMTDVSGNAALPNGMSPGAHAGRVGRAVAALPEEATQASATQAMSVTGAPPIMYPAQAGQVSMQQAPMPPVQGAMLPTGPPVTLTVASPGTQHSIGINADLFHMKHMEIALSQEEVDRADLSGMTPGEVLVRFLEFFGRQFDPSRLGISVGRGALGNPFPLSPGVDPRTGMAVMDAHMVIEDPLDRDQNVARSCFGFPQVQWLFGQCLSLLQDRGAEMAEYDCNADLLKMLVYF